jgi:hypothetical protein
MNEEAIKINPIDVRNLYKGEILVIQMNIGSSITHNVVVYGLLRV